MSWRPHPRLCPGARAVSRYEDAVICSHCGKEEAYLDLAGTKTPACVATVILDDGWGLGLATRGASGYLPLPLAGAFDSEEEADAIASRANQIRRLSEKEVHQIISDTMARRARDGGLADA